MFRALVNLINIFVLGTRVPIVAAGQLSVNYFQLKNQNKKLQYLYKYQRKEILIENYKIIIFC